MCQMGLGSCSESAGLIRRTEVSSKASIFFRLLLTLPSFHHKGKGTKAFEIMLVPGAVLHCKVTSLGISVQCFHLS